MHYAERIRDLHFKVDNLSVIVDGIRCAASPGGEALDGSYVSSELHNLSERISNNFRHATESHVRFTKDIQDSWRHADKAAADLRFWRPTLDWVWAKFGEEIQAREDIAGGKKRWTSWGSVASGAEALANSPESDASNMQADQGAAGPETAGAGEPESQHTGRPQSSDANMGEEPAQKAPRMDEI